MTREQQQHVLLEKPMYKEIYEFVRLRSPKLVRSKEITKNLKEKKYPPGSMNYVLSRLVVSGLMEKPERGYYKISSSVSVNKTHSNNTTDPKTPHKYINSCVFNLQPEKDGPQVSVNTVAYYHIQENGYKSDSNHNLLCSLNIYDVNGGHAELKFVNTVAKSSGVISDRILYFQEFLEDFQKLLETTEKGETKEIINKQHENLNYVIYDRCTGFKDTLKIHSNDSTIFIEHGVDSIVYKLVQSINQILKCIDTYLCRVGKDIEVE